jgi:hypothetical protein
MMAEQFPTDEQWKALRRIQKQAQKRTTEEFLRTIERALQVGQLHQRITELEAHVKLLRDALEPFREAKKRFERTGQSGDGSWHWPKTISVQWGFIEAAATALRETEEGQCQST